MESPRLVCPTCQARAVHQLKTASLGTYVDYFICRACLQVWTLPHGRDEPLHFVTDPDCPRVQKSKSA